MSTLTRHSAPQQLAAAATLLVLLLAAVAPGPVGWLAGATYALVGGMALDGAMRRAGADTFGPAGLVTLVRAVLGGVVTALVVDGLVTGTVGVAALFVFAAVALVLDAVDGRVARGTDTVTAWGARFDMEADAALLLVLSLYVATLLGPWVLAIGLMRYAFVAAAQVWPWLGGSLDVRFSAKVVAALQGVVLVVVASGLLPVLLAGALVAAALGALAWSFAHDVARLHRASRPADVESAA